MKIRARLFGTLGQRFQDYNPDKGLAVEIPDGAKIKDLLVHLEISDADGVFVAVNNRVAEADQELNEGAVVQILQRASGG
jgi:sulfur carrier protein ThiS